MKERVGLVFDQENLMMLSELLSVIAFLVVLLMSMVLARRKGLDVMTMYWAGAWGILGALMGGALVHVLGQSAGSLYELLTIERILTSGKSVFGAFIGAGVVGWIYLKAKGENFWVYSDLLMPAIALGYVIARIGCFINGDDFGSVTDLPWSIQFDEGTDAHRTHLARMWIRSSDQLSLPTHPTQLYHALAGMFLFVVLMRLNHSGQGCKTAWAFVLYGITRFVIQFFRDDHSSGGTMIDHAQWFSLFFIFLGMLLWWRSRLLTSIREFR